MLTQLKPLTQEERQAARTAAQEAVQRDIGNAETGSISTITEYVAIRPA